MNTLTLGIDTLTYGIDTLTCGMNTLTLGIDTLTLGIDTLTCGMNTLTLGIDTLTCGIYTLILGVEPVTLGQLPRTFISCLLIHYRCLRNLGIYYNNYKTIIKTRTPHVSLINTKNVAYINKFLKADFNTLNNL